MQRFKRVEVEGRRGGQTHFVTYFLAPEAFLPAVLAQQVALMLGLKCHLILQLKPLWELTVDSVIAT